MSKKQTKPVSVLLKHYGKRYFITAMGAMAQGLFASLLIGTIFKALGMIPSLGFLAEIGGFAQGMAGPAMGVAIAHALGGHSRRIPRRGVGDVGRDGHVRHRGRSRAALRDRGYKGDRL